MSLALRASADGLAIYLLLGATVISTFSALGIGAGGQQRFHKLRL